MMTRTALHLLFIACFTTTTNAQEVIFGSNNYIEYQVGTLPLVISVAHGGSLEPASMPNRTCNNPVFAKDIFTIETALEIKNSLFNATGCYPHIIISHLKRNKLDPNRNLSDGACENNEAVTAWNEFHNFIKEAQDKANTAYNNQTFFVDLHGHGNSIQRIELGYLLYDDELELSDNTLNTTKYINYSSIKNLALNNQNNDTHAELLRGSKSFGTMLSANNYPSVPSQSIPYPGTNTNYFSGGYNTANHTSYSDGVSMNGLQMELNYTHIRDSSANRTAFSVGFARAIIDFINANFNINWNRCNPLSINDAILNKFSDFYPNPAHTGAFIYFDFMQNTRYEYTIVNSLGQSIQKGQLWSGERKVNTEKLEIGFYIMQLYNKQRNEVIFKKIIIK
jgi:hypothetical protein